MKKNRHNFGIPVASVVLFATAVSAEQDQYTYSDSTNRLTLSLRFGLNISAKFQGVGGSLAPGSAAANGRTTPSGDPYNYDNGYVGGVNGLRPDITGNGLGQTWYWGYDSASQVAGNTISFDRTTATGFPSTESGSNDGRPYPGLELSYDRQFGEKENWHHMRYGLEAAVNYTRISMRDNDLFNVTVSDQHDTYTYPEFPLSPPTAPYQGTFEGPLNPGGSGFTINVPAISSVTTAAPGTFLAQEQFDANLWGFRLGPYLEWPLSEKWDLDLSGGLAVGLLDADASWRETLTVGGVPTTTSGQDTNLRALWGYYVNLDATYQFSKRWGVEGGVQFQDLGKYNHNFSGRVAELDLSRSVFVHAGISYSF